MIKKNYFQKIITREMKKRKINVHCFLKLNIFYTQLQRLISRVEDDYDNDKILSQKNIIV